MSQGQLSVVRIGVAWALLAAAFVVPGSTQPLEPPAAPGAREEGGGVSRPLGEPAGPPRSGTELERLTEHLASRMRCPVCQGLSIADSRTISALNMKQEVRELLAAGYSEDQVLDYFEQAYGEFIRLVPKPRGFNLVVWVLPVAVLALGGAVVARVAGGRRVRKAPAADPAVADPSLADPGLAAYRDRVRKETSR